MSLFGGYGSDYRRAVFFQRLINQSREKAFEAAVGGAFETVGGVERDILLAEGLPADGLLVDIGCGAGRLAQALKDHAALSYVGVDVVPVLLDGAQRRAARPDWRFELVSETALPCVDETVSACAAFSVFTHLPEPTCLDYLREMRRVLMPGGIAIFSFLDPAVERHAKLLNGNLRQFILTRTAYARNVGFSTARVAEWARIAGYSARKIESPSRLGQSLAVFEKH